jgi:hypothetical protein
VITAAVLLRMPTRDPTGDCGDATKDHDVAVPPSGAAVGAGGSTRSPGLALHTRTTIVPARTTTTT